MPFRAVLSDLDEGIHADEHVNLLVKRFTDLLYFLELLVRVHGDRLDANLRREVNILLAFVQVRERDLMGLEIREQRENNLPDAGRVDLASLLAHDVENLQV